MKKRPVYKFMIFIMMVIFMCLLNILKTENDNDVVREKVNLRNDKHVECVVDIAKMGILKYYLEPYVFTVYLRCKNDINAENISYKTENINAFLSQGSKKGLWKQIREDEHLTENKNKIIPLSLEINIPKDMIYQYSVWNGKVKIISNENVLTIINIKVINSKYI